MKKLLVYNYKWELVLDYFNNFNLDILYMNEKKWWNFWFKLQKILLKNRYDIVFHRGLAWSKEDNVWNIYLIDYAYLSDWEKIFDAQKYRYVDNFDFKKSHIITKFKVGFNNPDIYEFSNIYDLESFWVASLTNFFWFPILTFKWVSDYNEFLTIDEEIKYLISSKSRIEYLNDKYKDIINYLSKEFSNIIKQF